LSAHLKITIVIKGHNHTRLHIFGTGEFKLLGAIASRDSDIETRDCACHLDVSLEASREPVLAESNNTIAVRAMSLHARPTLTKTEDTKTFAVISAIDTSIGIAAGLPSDTCLPGAPYTGTKGAESNDTGGVPIVAVAFYSGSQFAKAEDAKTFAIISAIDTESVRTGASKPGGLLWWMKPHELSPLSDQSDSEAG
jgi:hypothetical protein